MSSSVGGAFVLHLRPICDCCDGTARRKGRREWRVQSIGNSSGVFQWRSSRKVHGRGTYMIVDVECTSESAIELCQVNFDGCYQTKWVDVGD